jgi:hypothetical protein
MFCFIICGHLHSSPTSLDSMLYLLQHSASLNSVSLMGFDHRKKLHYGTIRLLIDYNDAWLFRRRLALLLTLANGVAASSPYADSCYICHSQQRRRRAATVCRQNVATDRQTDTVQTARGGREIRRQEDVSTSHRGCNRCDLTESRKAHFVERHRKTIKPIRRQEDDTRGRLTSSRAR